MRFVFAYRVRPENLLALALVNTYRSLAGAVNAAFTLAMVFLAFRFWREAGVPGRALMAAGMLLFPVFQPLAIYLRSKKIVNRMPEGMEMRIDETGIGITAGEQNSRVDFAELKSVIKIRGMLILYTRSRQGFILNRETLDGKERELYGFLERHAGGKPQK